MRAWPQTPQSKYQQAIFLDRDGTINEDTHYSHKIEELKLLDGVIEGLRELAKLPYEIIVVSNQAGIALNIFNIEQMQKFNSALLQHIENDHGRISAFYYCPHLEQKNLTSDMKPCSCSKPNPGMLLEAADDYNLDLANSFMIGDKSSDIIAGQNANCKTILVRTGKAGKEEGFVDVKPTYIADNLLEAAILIKPSLT